MAKIEAALSSTLQYFLQFYVEIRHLVKNIGNYCISFQTIIVAYKGNKKNTNPHQAESNNQNFIHRNNLAILLKSIASLAQLVSEAPAFGHWTVPAAVQQCFEQVDLN